MSIRDIRHCNVCVVGGAGFLGSHLVDHLAVDRGCNVLVIDNLITGRKEFVHPKAKFEYCDITGSESYLLKLFEAYDINFVFNYAAEPYIPVSFERPIHVFNINAFGALKVINAAHEAGVGGILQVSSAEIYGMGNLNCPKEAQHEGRICEECPVTPHSTYGAAKAAIDSMVQVRWKEAQVPVISLRQFNCIGERETHPYIVPEIISQLAKQPLKKHGKSEAVVRLGNNSFRDFQYAGDAVRMAVELLENGQFGQVYNMGSETGVKMYDLAKEIGEIMGFDKTEVVTDASRIRPWEIWHLLSDNTRLYQAIGERGPMHRAAALRNTVNSFRENGNQWAWESK